MKYQLATIVVTNAAANGLRDLAKRLDKGDMDGMFVVGLSATGAAPATHFISTGYVPKPLVKCMRDDVLMYNVAKAAWEADGEVFPYTQAQVTNTLSKCETVAGADDTEESLPETPFETIERLGLSLELADTSGATP